MIRKLVVYTTTVVCLLCPQVKANQHSVSTVKESIVKQSLELGIDPALALSIAKSESGFRHEARSAHGAVGVFQLMPSTAKRLGVNPYYLSGNIKGGLMYYKNMYNIFGSTELALAAYNAGPKIVKRYNKVPPFRETKRFVSSIMTEYNHQKKNPDPSITKLKNGSNKGVNKSNNIVKVSNVTPKPVATENLETKPNLTQVIADKPEHIAVEHKVVAKPLLIAKVEPKVMEHKIVAKPVVAAKIEPKVTLKPLVAIKTESNLKVNPKPVVAQKVEPKVAEHKIVSKQIVTMKAEPKAAVKPIVATKTELKVNPKPVVAQKVAAKIAPKPVIAVKPEHKVVEHKVISKQIITEKTGSKTPIRSVIPTQGVV